MKKVDYDDENLLIRFQGKDFTALNALMKSLDGFTWNFSTACWEGVPRRRVVDLLVEKGFEFTPAASVFLKKKKPSLLPARLDALYPYQKEGVLFAVKRKGVALIGDDMGLGKTAQAAGYLYMDPHALPAVVVCPASLKLNWQRELKQWADLDALVISGTKPYKLPTCPVYVVNYDILAYEDPEAARKERERKKKVLAEGKRYRRKTPPIHGWFERFIRAGVRSIIADEVQYIANPTSIRTRAFCQLAEEVDRARLFLSGTPIMNRAKEFFTALHLLAPSEFPDRWNYQMRYCGPTHNGFGWDFNGSSNLDELHSRLKRFMIRRMKSEVLTQLPPKRKCIVPLETDPVTVFSFHTEYADFQQWVRSCKKQDRAEGIKRLSHLKQMVYLSKRNAALQWVSDFLECGQKLVLFTYHINTMKDVLRKFPHAVYIDGSVTAKDRQAAVDRFQSDPRCTLFVGQIIAAGVGLTLTAASSVAFLEFADTPGHHTQAEDRVYRIGQTADSVTAYYLIAPGTIDEDMMDMLNGKYGDLTTILDGKKNDDFFDGAVTSFSEGLLQLYRKRATSE